MGFFSAVKKLFGSETAKENTQEVFLESASAEELEQFTIQLRQCEPKLSAWLQVILEGVDKADDVLWARLGILLNALETPEEEAKRFIGDFRAWTKKMDYRQVADFRSELQYRLALALDMEDEESEKDLVFAKLQSGLEKTRNQLGKGLQAVIAGHGKAGEAFFEDLEELFIMSDIGAELSLQLVEKLRRHAKQNNIEGTKELLPFLQKEVRELFKTPRRISAVNLPEVVLLVGVNGVGKTTTIAKLAYRAKMQGKKILIAGADTFRAAAVEQLEEWAKRIGVDFYSK